MSEQIALWLLVLQGFAIGYFEYDNWQMNRERYKERATWRAQKRSQSVKRYQGGEQGSIP